MKISSLLLTAFLSTVQATPIAASAHEISPAAVDIEDRSVLVKRLDYNDITWTAACWACMWAHYGTLGTHVTRVQWRIPRSLYQTSLLFAGICEVTGPCGTEITAFDADGKEKTYPESTWIAYTLNENNPA